MLKKILTLYIVFALLGSCMGVNSALAVSYNKSDYSYAYNFMSDLGIIRRGDKITASNSEDVMTRGQLALIAFRLYNGAISVEKNQYFTDVTGDDDESDAINTLARLGIVSGMGDGTFRPDKTIAYNDAISLILKIMGYFNHQGLDNNSYVYNTCRNWKLISAKHISSGDSAVGCLLDTVFKLMQKKMLVLTGIRGNIYDYNQTDDTILSKYFDIYKVSGILKYSGGSGLDLNHSYSDNCVVIDSFEIKDNTESYYIDYLGYNVDAFYRDKAYPQLVSIYKNENNNEKSIASKNISSFENWTYYYTDETGKNTNIKLKYPNVTVLHNGALLKHYSEGKMMPKDGIITLIDNDNDGSYEIVSVRDYISFVVSGIYVSDDKVTISSNNTGIPNISVITDEIYTVKTCDGHKLSIEEIETNSVLSVLLYGDDANRCTREIIVCNNRLNGTVESVRKDGADSTYLTINGVEHKLNSLSDIKNPKPGMFGEFYLDFANEIVYVIGDKELSNVAFGYLIDAEVSDGINKTVKLKIYDELGRIRVYECTKKVIVDGRKLSSVQDIMSSLLKSGNVNTDLILFSVNSDLQITMIDQAEDYYVGIRTEANNTLVKMANDNGLNSGRGLLLRSEFYNFGGRVIVDNSTRFFQIPSNLDNTEDYGILKYSDFETAYYNVQGYTTNVDTAICNLVVVTPNGRSIKNTSTISVVSKIKRSINDDGEETYTVTLFTADGEMTYILKNKKLIDEALKNVSSTDTTKYKIEAGDVVRYSLNSKGEIEQLLICYDYSEDKLLTNQKMTNTFSSSPRIINAVPYSVADGVNIKMLEAPVSDYSAIKANDFQIAKLSRFKKIIEVRPGKTPNRPEVSEAGADVIRTYLDFNDKMSKLVINFESSVEKVLVVYNED